MKLHSLQDLLIDELRDLYHAENQILKALPKMVKAASSPNLKDGLEEHLEQTREHIERLERIFKDLDANPRGKTCKGLEGIIEEGAELLRENAEADVKDAGLVAVVQKIEHYEMAGYGCARTWARQLGHDHIADLLQQTLEEEELTDERLTLLAESSINLQAAHQ
jgi:ferritin-like metal-binding protein YciE